MDSQHTDRPRDSRDRDRDDEPRDEGGELGSLAQGAREKKIASARTLLLVIGILSLAVNGFMFANTENEIAGELKKNGVSRAQVDPVLLKQVQTMCYLIYGVGAGLGVLFLIFSGLVRSYPVPITMAGLVIYILANIGFGILDPANLARGLIIKIFIIVGLVSSLQAALAYERERNAAYGAD